MTPGKGTGGEHVMTGTGDAPGIASLGTDLEQSSAPGARSGQAVPSSGSWLLGEPDVVAVDARHGFSRVLEEDSSSIFGDDDSNQAMADVVLLGSFIPMLMVVTSSKDSYEFRHHFINFKLLQIDV
ncbi:unnamed protein product [Ilex paraguariensis]|uniref:Uncharacterized protein n=1 Tax=Ilex paraguariensis TaxID=185542 RepID=A0ABC8RDH3_9AQUA